jgi:divalent metal cation (Fe/Co/Zn/Cd) transporter
MQDATPSLSSVERNALRRRGLLLVWIGEGWNVLEAAVALWSAVAASSVALLAFGLDSLIEILAGLVLIWRLGREWKEGEAEAESKALRILGVSFFVLAAYIAIQATTTLLGWFPEPQESPLGILLVVASAAIMTFLYVAKSRIARKLGSRALRAEAIESLVCDLQDLTVLAGLGLNALLGWWWADPVAAIALIPFLLKEGIESFSEHA